MVPARGAFGRSHGVYCVEFSPPMPQESRALDSCAQEEQAVFYNNVLGLTEAEIREDIENALCEMQIAELEEVELFLQRTASGE